MFTKLRSLDEREESGRLAFRERQVIYSPPQGSTVFIPVSDLIAVGEYTTPGGPLVDDYYLAFVIRGGAWFETSFYAAGRDAMLESLGEVLGSSMVLDLANSTTWRSRVLWPPAVEGKELFEFLPQNFVGLSGHLKRLVGVQDLSVRLTKEVLRELERA